MSDPAAKLQLASFTGAELAALAKARLPRGHGAAHALYRRAMREQAFEPQAEGLGPEACSAWQAGFALDLPSVVRVAEEDTDLGPTAKLVLALHDGLECEAVVLPMGRGRTTLCISSQVGCKMGCKFCETARMGLLRSLAVHEIVGQILRAKSLGYAIDNVVFMGMGEALDNADAVIQALRVITDPAGLAMGQEKVTVCTVGRIDGIRKLGQAGFRRLNLSVSLNAADDALRSALMPINRTVPLAELQAALVAYRPRANFAFGVNYCLLPGLNDAEEHAAGIARFCEPLGRVMVNLIPYNPGSAPLTRFPEEHEIERFVSYLRAHGLPVRRRITKGRSVMAACGQLGNVELRQKRKLGLLQPSEP
jgi:23S rRNA (adenine2503-C2)-methyltransferase